MEYLMSKTEKYGFVYIWYDRKHKRYYVGCHWGHVDDGYVCSSTWMRNSYKRRPTDFKRRIISKIYTNRADLLEEEFKYLSMIKKEELSKKYYNFFNHKFGLLPDQSGHKNSFYGKKHTEESKKKIKEARSKQVITEETKQKLSISHIGEKNSFYGKTHNSYTKELISNKSKELWQNKEFKEKMKNRKKGKSNSETLKERWKDPIFKELMLSKRKQRIEII
jgi:hypothetical protein